MNLQDYLVSNYAADNAEREQRKPAGEPGDSLNDLIHQKSHILGNCNTQIYLGLQHEEDVMTAKRALFLEQRDEVFLDRLAVGEAIVKIKGRVGPCLVKFPLVPIKKGAVADDFVPPGGEGDEEAVAGTISRWAWLGEIPTHIDV